MTTNGGTHDDIGVGLISVGWMGKLHTRSYQALPYGHPELGLRPRLVHAADPLSHPLAGELVASRCAKTAVVVV